MPLWWITTVEVVRWARWPMSKTPLVWLALSSTNPLNLYPSSVSLQISLSVLARQTMQPKMKFRFYRQTLWFQMVPKIAGTDGSETWKEYRRKRHTDKHRANNL